MLIYPDKRRYTAEQAFEHKWIQSKASDSVKAEIIKDAMINMKNFRVK